MAPLTLSAGVLADLGQRVAECEPEATGEVGGEVGDQSRTRVPDLLDLSLIHI